MWGFLGFRLTCNTLAKHGYYSAAIKCIHYNPIMGVNTGQSVYIAGSNSYIVGFQLWYWQNFPSHLHSVQFWERTHFMTDSCSLEQSLRSKRTRFTISEPRHCYSASTSQFTTVLTAIKSDFLSHWRCDSGFPDCTAHSGQRWVVLLWGG